MWLWPWASSEACPVALPALVRADNGKGRKTMTNKIALVLAFLIIGAVVVDVVYFGTDHILFLAKKLTDLIEWLAFWR